MKTPALRYVTLATKSEDVNHVNEVKANENFLNQDMNDLLEYLLYLEARVAVLEQKG